MCAQEASLDNVVLHRGKRDYSASLAYEGLSRVRTLGGVALFTACADQELGADSENPYTTDLDVSWGRMEAAAQTRQMDERRKENTRLLQLAEETSKWGASLAPPPSPPMWAVNNTKMHN